MNSRIFVSILVVFTIFGVYLISNNYNVDSNDDEIIKIINNEKIDKINDGRSCTYPTCLTTDRCLLDPENLKIYVQPLISFYDNDGKRLNPRPSEQFLKIRKFIQSSRYYTSNPHFACLIIPGIDTLSTSRYNSIKDVQYLMLESSHLFDFEPNFMIFHFFGAIPEVKAVIASSISLHSNFRHYFDLSIPLFDISFYKAFKQRNEEKWTKKYVVIDVEKKLEKRIEDKLSKIIKNDFTVLKKCNNNSLCNDEKKQVDYINVLKNGDFIILNEDLYGYESILMDSLKYNCIPIIISDLMVLPFEDIIDWNYFSFIFSPIEFEIGIQKINKMNNDEINEMKDYGKKIYEKYFNSLEKIIEGSLSILEHRLVPTIVESKNEVLNNHFNEDFMFLPKCNYYLSVILHRKDSSITKLQWMLRFFLYTETNSSMIVIFTEEELTNVFNEFIVPTKSIPIRVVNVNNVDNYYKYIDNYETECLLFVVNSNYQSSLLDENIMRNGFIKSSEIPHRIMLFTSNNEEQCNDYQCPYFIHSNYHLNSNDVVSMKLNDCDSLMNINKNTGYWISCSI